ncbi:MAG: hypothetical protein HZA51_10400 [Planctomycetes bacterium]|nr:hypothetical protein [Planctomycetota bacterium]
MQRKLLFAFIGSIVCCAVVGIYCLLVGGMGRTEERILGTTAAVGACSMLALAAAIPWERRRWHPIGPVSIMAIVAALGLTVYLIWFDTYPHFLDIRWERFAISAWVFACALPTVGLLSLARLRSNLQVVLGLTIVSIATLVLMLQVAIFCDYDVDNWMRGIGVFAILSACGTITVPILHRVSAIKTTESVQTTELSISMTCPRCSTTQVLAAGRSACSSCHLRFHIEIEEDNCVKCGYPLYQLKSAVCPECGTPIANANHPHPAA